jgi:ubiquinone/menaquinone biosynthesis C-methylase UbiE
MGASTPIGQGFRDADQAAAPQALVNYLASVGALDQVQGYKRQMLALLDPRPGAHLLDVGCGAGDDARELGWLVGPAGAVVGVDQSAVMIAETRERTREADLPVEFRVGDAHYLAFADDTFDGCRAERTLQHVADPAQVVREMARVAKPGAPVVVAEPDWATTLVHPAQRSVTRQIVATMSDRTIRNGQIGRALRALFQDAGLVRAAIVPFVVTLTDCALARRLMGWDESARLAQEEGLLTAAEVADWLAELQDAGERGRFFAAVTGFVVAGHKPDGP